MKKDFILIVVLVVFCEIKTFAQQGQTLNFNNNSNTAVALTNNIQLLDSFTIEAWIYPESKGDFYTLIGNKSLGIASPRYFLALNNYVTFNGKIVFETQNMTNVSVNSVAWNQWQYIALTWNGSLARKYINGVIQEMNDSINMNLQASSSPCYLGDIPAYFGNGNNLGNIDELRVWNYARTQSELQSEMFCELSQSQIGLTAYYQFNEGIAGSSHSGFNTLPDLLGNNNTGNLINFGLSGTSTNWLAPVGKAAIHFSQSIESCKGSEVQIGNNIYTTDGIYFDTPSSSNGCDSLITTNILNNLSGNISQNFSFCMGDIIVVGNSIY